MTNPDRSVRSSRPNPASSRWALCACLGSSILLAGLAGCGGEEEQAAVTPPPRRDTTPKPPAAPPVVPVAQLMQELSIDSRVSLPEDMAPDTTADRRAVLEFFDAFARGDDTALEAMLSLPDKMELQKVAETVAWTDTIEDIREIRVQAGSSPFGQACVLAIFSVGVSDYQAQLWTYESSGSEYAFSAQPTPPYVIDRLSGTDWIAAWFDLIRSEMELAFAPDREPDPIRQVLDDGGNDDSSGGGGASPSAPQGPADNPGIPTRPPGRRNPGGPPRRPPGPGN